MRSIVSRLLLPLTAVALLAGCAAHSGPASLTTRQTLADSVLLLAVDATGGGMTYGDLLVFVDNVPYHLGGHMDHGQKLFEVAGKEKADDKIAIGDTIRVPVAGSINVQLRHAGSGAALQQLTLLVPDATPPAALSPTLPHRGANGVQTQAVFQWVGTDDPSGVTYTIEYWVASQGVNAPHSAVSGLVAASYPVPAGNALFPATPYHWHVRAVDGVGNVGPWSDEWEFMTTA